MMTRTERFSPVLKIAEIKKRDAARVAAKSNQAVAEYERKLSELVSFRKEYRLSDHVSNRSMSATELKEHQKFVGQLDEGISILKSQLEGHRQNNQIDRQAWMEAHQRSDAMDKLMGKMQKLEQRIRETRVDNELDDRSQHTRVKN